MGFSIFFNVVSALFISHIGTTNPCDKIGIFVKVDFDSNDFWVEVSFA
jgi:hypothetical protein